MLIWNDDKFPLLSDDAQIVFFHLLTTPQTTTFGLFKGGVGTLAEEKRWPPERYRDALRILVSQGMVHYDRDALLLYIPRALRYNPPSSVKVIKEWAETFKSLPSSSLKKDFYIDLKTTIVSRSKEALIDAFLECFGDGGDLSADDRAPLMMDTSSMTVSHQQPSGPARERDSAGGEFQEEGKGKW